MISGSLVITQNEFPYLLGARLTEIAGGACAPDADNPSTIVWSNNLTRVRIHHGKSMALGTIDLAVLDIEQAALRIRNMGDAKWHRQFEKDGVQIAEVTLKVTGATYQIWLQQPAA